MTTLKIIYIYSNLWKLISATNSCRMSRWKAAVIVRSHKNDPINHLEKIVAQTRTFRDAGMMVQEHRGFSVPKMHKFCLFTKLFRAKHFLSMSLFPTPISSLCSCGSIAFANVSRKSTVASLIGYGDRNRWSLWHMIRYMDMFRSLL